MKPETEIAANDAGGQLNLFLARMVRDSAEVIQRADIPEVIAYFAELRALVDELSEKTAALRGHIESLSHEVIPTLFTNKNVKTITIPGVGRATVNNHWSASMIDKAKAFNWLRSHNAEGLIIETVNAQTLGAFAAAEVRSGHPLPSAIFNVTATPFISVTRRVRNNHHDQ